MEKGKQENEKDYLAIPVTWKDVLTMNLKWYVERAATIITKAQSGHQKSRNECFITI